MLIQSNELPDGHEISVDLCIIGSGAAGLSIAAEFVGTSTSVAILESGTEELRKEVQPLNDIECTDLPIASKSRVRQYGGTTNVWAGKWMPMLPFDLEEKTWLKQKAWPLSIEQLIPYYDRASSLHAGPPADAYGNYSDQAVPVPEDEDSPFIGVPAFWLKVRNIGFAQTIGLTLYKEPNIDVYLSATASNLVLNADHDAIETIEVRTGNNKTIKVHAKKIVLAGGGIENPRLMLASNTQQQAGIGNQHDNVGRYFMDHPKGYLARIELNEGVTLTEALGIRYPKPISNRMDFGARLNNEKIIENESVNSYLLIHPHAEHAPDEKFRQFLTVALNLKAHPVQIKGYFLAMKEFLCLNQINFWKVLFYRLSLKINRRPPTVFDLEFHIEQAPGRNNRITLTAERDMYGNPLPKLESRLTPVEQQSIHHLHDELAARLKQGNYGTLKWNHDDYPPDDLSDIVTDSSHHMGTTRMGLNPEDSVVDTDCKVHGVDNLYIAGSSVFPSGGFANPTFTIVALAIKLADHLKSSLK